MKDEIFEVQLSNPDRPFVKVYKDFLASSLLTVEEKMVYIALKSFVTYGQDTGEVFPSMETLCKLTTLSRPRATRTISSLVKKGIIKKVRRGLTKTNLYTLVDVPSMWEAETIEQMQQLADNKIQLSSEEMLEELKRRGVITFIKEKELESVPTKAQKQALEKDQYDINDNIVKISKSQEQETYSLYQIKEYFGYNSMLQDNPYLGKDIDSVMGILHTTLNTSKPVIRVGGEDKPSMVVIGTLMKLSSSGILYAIEKYKEQTERIKNPTGYMLTLLYNAETQMNLDISNQVRHDMANWA